MPDYVQPIIGGLLTGVSIGNMLRNAAVQREELAMRQQQLAQQQQMQDAQMQERMTQAGRPVVGGMVEEDAVMPDVPGFVGIGGTPYKKARKADASRLVKYKTADGRMIESELYTPQDQAKMAKDRAIEQAKAMADIKAEELRKGAIPLPPDVASLLGAQPGTMIQPAQLDELARAAASIGELKRRVEMGNQPAQKKVRSSNLTKDDSGRQTQVLTFDDGTVEERQLKSRGTTRPAKGGGADGERGMTPGQSAVQDRFGKRRVDELQERIDKLQEQEDALHAKRIKIGQAATYGGIAPEKVPESKAELDSLLSAVKAKQRLKEALIRQKEAAMSQAGMTGGAKPSGKSASGGKVTHRFNPATGQIEAVR